MKNCRASICLTTSVLVLALNAPIQAQDSAAPMAAEKPAAADEAQMMAAMMELAKPGENHKILQEGTGSWT